MKKNLGLLLVLGAGLALARALLPGASPRPASADPLAVTQRLAEHLAKTSPRDFKLLTGRAPASVAPAPAAAPIAAAPAELVRLAEAENSMVAHFEGLRQGEALRRWIALDMTDISSEDRLDLSRDRLAAELRRDAGGAARELQAALERIPDGALRERESALRLAPILGADERATPIVEKILNDETLRRSALDQPGAVLLQWVDGYFGVVAAPDKRIKFIENTLPLSRDPAVQSELKARMAQAEPAPSPQPAPAEEFPQ